MDPLTHTLFGASLASTRLSEKTKLATPALVIGANLPDVDVLAYFLGGDAALGFRRGWTHGILALVLLPPLLALGLWLWARLGSRPGSSDQVSSRWLLTLSYLAVATHPTLDWLNTYGMRWWMPFADTWYYGDSVFIIDPWLWLVLGVGWLIGRTPGRGVVASFVVLAALILAMVWRRAPMYLPAVAIVLALLLLALCRRPEAGRLVGRRAAAAGLVLAMLYIGSLVCLHAAAENRVRQLLARPDEEPNELLMVGPRPVNPLRWDVVARQGKVYRYGSFSWLRGGVLELSGVGLVAADRSALWPEILASGQAGGFLRWVRFPWLELETDGPERRVFLMDARYTRQRTEGFGGVRLTLPIEEVLASGRLEPAVSGSAAPP